MLPDYKPAEFEDALMKEDLAAKRFRSEVNPQKKPYTIVMPPQACLRAGSCSFLIK